MYSFTPVFVRNTDYCALLYGRVTLNCAFYYQTLAKLGGSQQKL
jgi:hypothetical protein